MRREERKAIKLLLSEAKLRSGVRVKLLIGFCFIIRAREKKYFRISGNYAAAIAVKRKEEEKRESEAAIKS